ncbi:hypothetical protein BJY24_001085 [Nocardia transvalensis]|uniref:Uncharacterized protein n=1 Tax=Nocardia transvalensis TaxID=37333 RepID=A0A7W9PAJ6_9NOCA|nr:hypothetical protein [Nocardia transvalensis]MBB5912218.1 hypothetical protein [Nocardia transvalensis]
MTTGFDRRAILLLVVLAGTHGAALVFERRLLPAAGAGILTLTVVALGRFRPGPLANGSDPAADPPEPDRFLRWRARATVLLEYADGSRAEWDRHVRPILAREFQLAVGHRETGGGAAPEIGRDFFGARLWPWVDPGAVAPAGTTEPGPGGGVFLEILERLERL